MAASLIDITLPSLEHVGYLSVYYNTSLENMDMPELRTLVGNAEIQENINLPTCDVTAIRDALTFIGGTFDIWDNFPDECDI